MDTGHDTVAVIVPVHIGTFVEDCLESIAVQTRPPDQIIVVNDGSPQEALVREAVETLGRPVTVITQANMGAGMARNAGIRAATAEYVAFLDADDYWYPTLLETLLGLLRNRPERAAAFADAHIVGDSPFAGRRVMDVKRSRTTVTRRTLIAQESTVVTSTVVARRRAIVESGLFDPDLQRGQDLALWVRMVQHGEFVCRREPLAAWRAHARNLWGGGFESSRGRMLPAELEAIREVS